MRYTPRNLLEVGGTLQAQPFVRNRRQLARGMAQEGTLPAVISTSELARELSKRGSPISARKVRRLLMPTGALEKIGNDWFTERSKLWEKAPLVARVLFLQAPANDQYPAE